MDDAACKGMAPAKAGEDDPFFPRRGQSHLRKQAKEICASCPVATECLEFRDKTESMYGIWGGTVAKRGRQAE